MTDPHTTLFGNPQCHICQARHPIGYDCVAENRRRRERMTESLKNIRHLSDVQKSLFEIQDEDREMSRSRIEMGKLYVHRGYTFIFAGIDTINVVYFTRTGILIQGLELWYRSDKDKLSLETLNSFMSKHGFPA